MKKRAPRLDAPTPQQLLHDLAKAISPAAASPEELRRGEQWKVWLTSEEKGKEDLISELKYAPGKGILDKGSFPYYNPSKVQWSAHRADKRVKQFVAGWRAGKSKWLAAELLFHLFKDNARIWIVGRDYQLAREEFNYIQQWLEWLDVPMSRPPSKPQEGRWQLWTDWGAHLQTMSASDVSKLEAARLDAAGVAEAGGIDYAVIDRLFGRTLESNGPVLLAGSLENTQQWYVDALDTNRNGSDLWQSFTCPSWDNLEVFPGGREDKKIKEQEQLQAEDDFLRKVACIVVRSKEVVFHEYDAKKHLTPIIFRDRRKVTMDEMSKAYSPFDSVQLYPEAEVDTLTFQETKWYLPDPSVVHLAIDPGIRFAYAVLAIVKYDDKVWVIDEIYEQSSAQDIIAICKTKEWWPYVRNGSHVIDIAGNQRDTATGISNVDIWREQASLHVKSVRVPVPDGISRLKTFLLDPATRRPRIWFDPRVANLRNEFALYKYRKNYEGRAGKEEPIDANNHAVKALIYWLVYHYGWAHGRGKVRSERYITQQPAIPFEGERRQPDSQYPVNDGWAEDFGFDWSRTR